MQVRINREVIVSAPLLTCSSVTVAILGRKDFPQSCIPHFILQHSIHLPLSSSPIILTHSEVRTKQNVALWAFHQWRPTLRTHKVQQLERWLVEKNPHPGATTQHSIGLTFNPLNLYLKL